ncbi:hypothetical protein OUZ56_026185 [Daphnia magna]|uniref:Uncharacterized protein n=1 Tax=Daphnia magna TaxID=35525 RepID=A0ABQ9ZL47_9CRUS|nr:hypothetical protein OUZ56_026185 [Daphnia magna]
MVESKMNFTLLLKRSQWGISVYAARCPTIRPSNLFYLRSFTAGNLLCIQLLNKELGRKSSHISIRLSRVFRYLGLGLKTPLPNIEKI